MFFMPNVIIIYMLYFYFNIDTNFRYSFEFANPDPIKIIGFFENFINLT